MRRLFLLLGISFAFLSTAGATTGLVWKLDQGPVSYLLDARISLPEVLYIRAETNIDRRTTELRVLLVTTCAVDSDRGKKAWMVSCSLDDVALYGVPVLTEEGDLLPVLDHWDEKLTGGTMVIEFTRRGRIKNVNLKQVYVSRNSRTIDITETMRLLLFRAFSAMDLEFPKTGDDLGGPWRQGETAALGFMDSHGTLGSARISSQVTSMDGSVAVIETLATGTIGPAEMMPAGNSERPANLYETEFQSLTLFDTQAGRMVSRRFQSQGKPTPSSRSASSGQGFRYLQDVTLALVEGEAPKLGANREIPGLGMSTFNRGVINP